MRMSGRLSGLNSLSGTGNVKALTTDKDIQEALESLMRSAALNTVKEIKSGMSGLSQANNEYEFDRQLERDVMQKTLDGLAYGDLEAITAAEFSRELQKELSGGQMNGFFSSLKNAVTKVVKAPLTLHKKLVKAVKKGAAKLKPFVKKYGVVIAAGVALYYGGPAAMAAVKKAWAKYQASKAQGIVESGEMGPPPPEGYDPSTIGNLANNSEAIEKGATLLKAQMEKAGTPMNSPGAWDFLKGVVKGELKKKAASLMQSAGSQSMGPPAPAGYGIGPQPLPGYRAPAAASTGGGMMLPLAVGAAALLFMNK